jgi:hypothetical protein
MLPIQVVPSELGGLERVQAQEEIRRSTVAILTWITISVTALAGWRQFLLARTRQGVERFQSALSNLDAASPVVKVGAVRALKALADEEDSFHRTVCTVLSAYVLANPFTPKADNDWLEGSRPDVHQALVELGSLSLSALPADGSTYVFLAGARIGRALLERASFRCGLFEGALLSNLVTRSSVFTDCNFTNAEVLAGDHSNSEFTRCDFTGATLSGSFFIDCPIRASTFDGTILDEVRFVRCDLTGTTFVGAELAAEMFADCFNPPTV